MASQMYSRYVPPSRKSVPAVREVSAPILDRPDPEPSHPAPPKTRQDASSTYARYVPPSKNKSKPTSTPAKSPTNSSSPSVAKRKRENETELLEVLNPVKKEKKETKAVTVNGTQSTAHVDDGQTEQMEQKVGRSSLETDKLVADGIRSKEKNVAMKKDSKEKKVSKSSAETKKPTEYEALEQTASGYAAPKQSKQKKKKRRDEEEQSANGVDGNAEDLRHNKLMEKRQKSLRKAEKLAKSQELPDEEDILMPDVPIQVHDLGPLPQPEPVPELPSLPISASLPKWLASPIRVSPTATAKFEEIGIPEDVTKVLHQKGYIQAFAVQAAVLPLLLPGENVDPGDVLVSAATGSGKTLSYVLPMVEDLSRYSTRGLRGLIVMPTRELVTQAHQVSEICASAFARGDGYTHRVKIGTAVGNETIEVERRNIMGDHLVYDTERYDAEMKEANIPWKSIEVESRVFGREQSRSKIRGDVVKSWPQVDILICTPGRLVDHLKSTPGFSISHLQWLVVDEADKLLDQSFQQWLPTVMAGIRQKQAVRKVILSATMTRDVGKLNQLKLIRPKLVVLDGTGHDENETSGTGHVLPSLLMESSVKVDDETVKPLYLMELMKREKVISPTEASSDEDHSSSESDSDSDSSDSDSSNSDEEGSSDASPAVPSREISDKVATDSPHGVLIFTKSNESAVRLGRLLALISPSLSSSIRTLTATTPRASRERTITSFTSGKISIIVASDLASRGLDLPNLAHVINYDVPSSIESYVHRIGRTARAGKKGNAWTLFTATEGRWFWNEIGRSESIERANGSKIGRLTIKEDAFASLRPRYEEALETLGKEASSSKAAKT
ncbi:ATP-dependent RNA helicase dbp6 [Cadophora gregata]|uniref:ATP-dependent RNA helicase dbp6 n=1 Tax=Cadophora gregata TaxID=51156 RepID=UPI0026DD017E|nr:ATP-dependent RNA helicase dbp6 [Cadophora gregata]KAK0121677.1 ATP-dependent RNA helicase dbp6 [Cadophora gregata]KAK0127154.1 ATP-dependent RNA helicase dbp6 [Cadophora gregata f. sp. sojae]